MRRRGTDPIKCYQLWRRTFGLHEIKRYLSVIKRQVTWMLRSGPAASDWSIHYEGRDRYRANRAAAPRPASSSNWGSFTVPPPGAVVWHQTREDRGILLRVAAVWWRTGSSGGGGKEDGSKQCPEGSSCRLTGGTLWVWSYDETWQSRGGGFK
jgi:hypothetical protein